MHAAAPRSSTQHAARTQDRVALPPPTHATTARERARTAAGSHGAALACEFPHTW